MLNTCRIRTILILMIVDLFARGDDVPLYSTESQLIIACVGDSITRGTGDEIGYLPYPTVLENLLGKGSFYVRNFGKGGSHIVPGERDYRVLHADTYEKALNSNADVFLLEFGTNDAFPSLWNETQFRISYGEVITDISSLPQQPVLVLMVPPPYVYEDDKLGPPSEHPVNFDVPRVVPEIAKKYDLALVNNFEFFGGFDNWNRDWYDIPDDGVHPNGAGYEAIALNAYRKLASEVWPENFGFELTYIPSYAPTTPPSSRPTSAYPSSQPSTSFAPTATPSMAPVYPPTSVPTPRPSPLPTYRPTHAPTTKTPSSRPTLCPVAMPTPSPSPAPSPNPTRVPTSAPSTEKPTPLGSAAPTTSKPTVRPTTATPTTVKPTASESPAPTTMNPTTSRPVAAPTMAPFAPESTQIRDSFATMQVVGISVASFGEEETEVFERTVAIVMNAGPQTNIVIESVQSIEINRRRSLLQSFDGVEVLMVISGPESTQSLQSQFDSSIESGEFGRVLRDVGKDTALAATDMTAVTVSSSAPTPEPTPVPMLLPTPADSPEQTPTASLAPTRLPTLVPIIISGKSSSSKDNSTLVYAGAGAAGLLAAVILMLILVSHHNQRKKWANDKQIYASDRMSEEESKRHEESPVGLENTRDHIKPTAVVSKQVAPLRHQTPVQLTPSQKTRMDKTSSSERRRKKIFRRPERLEPPAEPTSLAPKNLGSAVHTVEASAERTTEAPSDSRKNFSKADPRQNSSDARKEGIKEISFISEPLHTSPDSPFRSLSEEMISGEALSQDEYDATDLSLEVVTSDCALDEEAGPNAESKERGEFEPTTHDMNHFSAVGKNSPVMSLAEDGIKAHPADTPQLPAGVHTVLTYDEEEPKNDTAEILHASIGGHAVNTYDEEEMKGHPAEAPQFPAGVRTLKTIEL